MLSRNSLQQYLLCVLFSLYTFLRLISNNENEDWREGAQVDLVKNFYIPAHHVRTITEGSNFSISLRSWGF